MGKKKISEQTIVITGASSGIGLATARLAASKGARVVLSSRNENELQRIVDQLRAEGGQVVAVAADVADEQQLHRVADVAVQTFGGIDTWFNNAGVALYGSVLEMPIEDQRRLFDTNFWGEVNGTLVAFEHLRRSQGTLINMGSLTSERAIPLQAIYSASKHAVRAYSDGLRAELEKGGVPVAVVTVEPGSIDTPYTEHARNYMDQDPQLPPPIYAPEVVARAVLRAAEHPQRTVIVGGGAKSMATMEKVAPRMMDKMVEGAFWEGQKQQRAPRRADALYEPPEQEGQVRGHNRGAVMRHSGYTWASQHKSGASTLFLAAAAAFGGLLAARSLRSESHAQPASYGRWRAGAQRSPTGPVTTQPQNPPPVH